jgi:hypothetical protein
VVAALLGLGAVVLAAAPLAAGAGSATTRTHAGALRDIPRATHVASASSKVSYHGGPVLHSNRTHVIFWQPSGSGLRFDPGYMALVKRFLRDVAVASHSTSNVLGLTGQYTDAYGGRAAYASHWSGAVLDTDHLPRNDCTEPPTAPPWTHCVSDSRLQTEIQRVVHVDRLPQGPQDVYFLVLPSGFGSCMASGSCALGGADNGYCGYHSSINYSLLYAVIPYNAVAGHCQWGNPRPNGSTADPALSTISHELAETITDPLSNAWTDNSGSEIGDLCLTDYGRKIGGSGQSRYNENIAGGHYYLQEEWSNAARTCKPRADPDHAWFSISRRVNRTGTVWFVGAGRDPEGQIVHYHWSFGDGSLGSGREVSHRFARGGSYPVTLRVTDSWRNWGFYTRAVAVASPAQAGRRAAANSAGATAR